MQEFPPHPLCKPTTPPSESGKWPKRTFLGFKFATHRAAGPSTWPSGHYRREERRAATQNHWGGSSWKGQWVGTFPQDPLKEGLKTFCGPNTRASPTPALSSTPHLAGPMVTSSFPQPAACSPRTQQPLGLICPGPWSILSPGGRPEPSLCPLVPFILLRRSHTPPSTDCSSSGCSRVPKDQLPGGQAVLSLAQHLAPKCGPRTI